MSIRPFGQQQPQIHPTVMVDEQATVIGAVQIDEHSSVWPQAVMRGDVQTISIGKRTSVQDGCVLHVTHDGPYSPGGSALTIGDDVTIGHNATLHGCSIGNQVLIGMGSTVLDRAIIEDQVMLAANSLVTPGKRLAAGYMYAGSPAQQKRPLTDKEKDMLAYMANNYVELKNQYME